MSGVVLCGGARVYRYRTGQCWGACGIADSIIVMSEGSPYYGATQTCTNCGDRWESGEMYPRPFRRGWRREQIAEAWAVFAAACDCPVDRDNDLYPIPCELHPTSPGPTCRHCGQNLPHEGTSWRESRACQINEEASRG